MLKPLSFCPQETSGRKELNGDMRHGMWTATSVIVKKGLPRTNIFFLKMVEALEESPEVFLAV